MIYFWVSLTYLLILIAVGAIRSGRVNDQVDFMVAGRKLGPFVLVGTLVATWVGTGSIFGNAERTYEIGILGLILPLGGILGIVMTDARHFRQRSIPVYGLSPFATGLEDAQGVHGVDERLSQEVFERGVRTMIGLLRTCTKP